jgi:hypothetical protein
MRTLASDLAFAFFTALVFLLPDLALAHTRLKIPVPRSSADGLKVGPCGGVARTATPTMLTVGQTIQVSWEETINHPGYYTFEFSPANDSDFVELKKVNDTQNAAGIHQYTTDVTIPDVPCDACTFRLIQYMTEDPANPRLYYSCADIKIAAAPGPNPTPTPVPGPVPAPGPGPGPLDGNPIEPTKPFAKMQGGCGMVRAIKSGRGGNGDDGDGDASGPSPLSLPPPPAWFILFALVPLCINRILRRSY